MAINATKGTRGRGGTPVFWGNWTITKGETRHRERPRRSQRQCFRRNGNVERKRRKDRSKNYNRPFRTTVISSLFSLPVPIFPRNVWRRIRSYSAYLKSLVRTAQPPLPPCCFNDSGKNRRWRIYFEQNTFFGSFLTYERRFEAKAIENSLLARCFLLVSNSWLYTCSCSHWSP